MQRQDENCRPSSLWRELLIDWLSEDDQPGELPAQAADRREETPEDMAKDMAA